MAATPSRVARRGRTRSGCRRAGCGRAPSCGSRSRCAPRSRAPAAGRSRRGAHGRTRRSRRRGSPSCPRPASRPRPPRRSRSSARARGGAGSAGRPRRCRTAARGSGSRRRRRRCPECSAIQPAWRPMTSTTRMRWWLSAVVCRRSIGVGGDRARAVSKPKVMSVPPRSLSIVFGTPITGTPSREPGRAPSVSSPPMAIRPVEPGACDRLGDPRRAVLARERVGPRGAEDRPAAVQDPARDSIVSSS